MLVLQIVFMIFVNVNLWCKKTFHSVGIRKQLSIGVCGFLQNGKLVYFKYKCIINLQ